MASTLGQMRQVVSTLPDVQQLQSSLNDQFSGLGNIAILNGVQLKGVSLSTAATNQVAHKLGRQAQGYFVTSISTGAIVWNDKLTDSVLPLHASAACTVDLWVY